MLTFRLVQKRKLMAALLDKKGGQIRKPKNNIHRSIALTMYTQQRERELEFTTLTHYTILYRY